VPKPQAAGPRAVPASPARPAAVKAAAKKDRRPAVQPAAQPAYDPMAPRLRRSSGPDRKLQSKLSDLERQIASKEEAVKELERRMAEPGFYADRVSAQKIVAEHQALSREVESLMADWEALQLSAARSESVPSPRP
jgi:uncharacterized coiled-coil protein SlyX